MLRGLARAAAAGTLSVALAAASAAPALAVAGSGSPSQTVGGPLLSTAGVVVRPLAGAPALPSGLSAQSWLVADMDTGAVLAARAPHARHLPASTLKTLTALTLLPRIDPATTVRPTEADVGVDGSKVGLVPGLPYPARQLFRAMLVVSANDAADALATAAGGQAQTLGWMNEEAHRLQADDTHAGTPSGLDAPGESSSAYDLALIARAAMARPDFRGYVQTRRSFVNAPHGGHIEIDTHDRLLTNFPGAIGVKNGYTVHAGATFIGAATRGGHTLVVTLMAAQPAVWREAAALLDWGFAALGRVQPVGWLVDPLPAASPRSTTVALSRRAVAAAARSGSPAPVGPVPIAFGVLGALLAVTTNAARLRRRSRAAAGRG